MYWVSVIDVAVVPEGDWAHMVCYVSANPQGPIIWSKTTNNNTELVNVKLAMNAMLVSVYQNMSRYVLYVQPPVNPNQPLAFNSTLPC